MTQASADFSAHWSHRMVYLPCDNPDFPCTHEFAAMEMERMRATPVVPRRPVVVLAGYHAWKFTVGLLARRLHGMVGGPEGMYVSMAYPLSGDIEAIARRVVREVDARFPAERGVGGAGGAGGAGVHAMTEVDVVGVSMGGLVARAAASLPLVDGQKRLRIARLFTLATPHRGAALAERVGVLRPDSAARCMRPGSEFLERLNAGLASAKYELVCYARLNDTWVGASRTAPPGREPIWVSGTRVLSHITITQDARIAVDIARRLRGEEPLAVKGTRPPRD